MWQCRGLSPLGAGAATLAWLLAFVAFRRRSGRGVEFCSRLVASCHAVLVTTAGVFLCAEPAEMADREKPMRCEHAALLTLSLGYFAYDLGVCLWLGTESALMLLHHAYSFAALARWLFLGVRGPHAACGLAALEITNPLLQARWFIRSAGYHNTWLFYVVEAIFIILFLTIRGCLGTYYTFIVMIHPKIESESKLQAIIVYTISLGFIYNICLYYKNKYINPMLREKQLSRRSLLATNTSRF